MSVKSSKETVKGYVEACANKVSMPLYKFMLLGILAGAFVSFGASSSSLAVHQMENVGLAKVVAGTIFPVGLMLIVIVGGELFTGNCMMVMGALKKDYQFKTMWERLLLVYMANFIGAITIATLIYFSGQYDTGSGALGGYTIKVALAKSSIPFGKALVSGILCNILVCLAVLMAVSATDMVGKLFAIFFPIMAFVIGSFEHCVANMYYIPAGLLAMANESYVAQAINTYGVSGEQLLSLNVRNFILGNLLPVTIGNIIGGMICIGIPMFLLHIGVPSRIKKIEQKEMVREFISK